MARKEQRDRLGNQWLSKRPNSPYWCRTWYDEQSRQTCRASLRTTDTDEARRRLARWIIEHGEVEDEPAEEVMVTALMHRHIAQHANRLVSANTVIYSMRKWCAFFPDATLRDITHRRQREFVEWMRDDGSSDGYIRRVLADGQSAINHAWKRGEIMDKIPIDLSLAPEGDPRERILPLDEMAALWRAKSPPHLKIYLFLAIITGARPAAITDLTTAQLDFRHRIINLNPAGRRQTKKRRPIVPMPTKALPVLRALPEGRLVTWNDMPVRSIRTTFQRVVERAGLAGTSVNLYALRHTMASELRARGVSEYELAGWMGHQAPHKTTGRYAKYSPDYRGPAARAVDSYISELEALLGGSLLDVIQQSAHV